jgi:hypothetical protein
MAAAMADEFDDLDDLEEEEAIPELPVYTQVQAWDVITAYFDEKGLVRQQLDSFDQVQWTSTRLCVLPLAHSRFGCSPPRAVPSKHDCRGARRYSPHPD